MRKTVIAILVSSFCVGSALAQTTPATPTVPSTTAQNPPLVSKTSPTKVRSAASIECSKQADAKGLHGKARKTYRAQCKKDMKKKQ